MNSSEDLVQAPSRGSAPRTYKVAVVTRTKNREVLLKRAARSVSQQSFTDYCWVVVNDGGSAAAVHEVVEKSGIARDKVLIIDHEHSLGMEAASNAGIRAVDSQYIVIHDDDDTWDPAFLERTVGFLEGQQRPTYAGVVTYSTYVSELIRGDQVVVLSEAPYQNKLDGVDLQSVIDRNLFPPISFLFERSVWRKIGGFDETLPVLGDWLFNMEFLLFADIGVLKEPLAFYHHRDRPDSTAPEYRNTVVEQVPLHQEYTQIVRNRFLRNNLNHSSVSLRLALQTQAVETFAAPAASRSGAVAPQHISQLARGDSDLVWTVAALNAALAERQAASRFKKSKLSALPPNATWSIVLPQLRQLNADIPTPPDFDSHAYLAANPDVAAEVQAGRQKSAFVHFIMHGRHEGRSRPSGEYRPPAQDLPQSSQAQPQRKAAPVFNSLPMTRFSHMAAGFEKVLHVAHHEWHGIRQASAYSPGQKLLISAHEAITQEDKETITQNIVRMGIERVCFQGYSEQMDSLLLHLHSVLGPSVKFFMISHVTTAQFDNHFEMKVIARLLSRLKFGLLNGIASVKPGFAEAIDGIWGKTIINYAPRMPMVKGLRSPRVEVYAPLDVGWRKNLFTNIIASSLARNVDVVKTANFPNGLEDVHDLSKLRLVGYLRGRDLFDEMARSSLTLIATLAECQPMTQLESFAVGTPALTGPLEVQEFADDPLMQLCTTTRLDNPALLARDIERIVDTLKSDPDGMLEMIDAHLVRRHAVATQNYAEFLEL